MDCRSERGFTTGTPWLALNPNYKEINVEAELQNPDSVFHTYRKLIHLRKDHPIVVWGDYELLETSSNVFAYYRTLGEERWLTVVNLSDSEEEISVDARFNKVLVTNTENEVTDFTRLQTFSMASLCSGIVWQLKQFSYIM